MGTGGRHPPDTHSLAQKTRKSRASCLGSAMFSTVRSRACTCSGEAVRKTSGPMRCSAHEWHRGPPLFSFRLLCGRKGKNEYRARQRLRGLRLRSCAPSLTQGPLSSQSLRAGAKLRARWKKPQKGKAHTAIGQQPTLTPPHRLKLALPTSPTQAPT